MNVLYLYINNIYKIYINFSLYINKSFEYMTNYKIINWEIKNSIIKINNGNEKKFRMLCSRTFSFNKNTIQIYMYCIF